MTRKFRIADPLLFGLCALATLVGLWFIFVAGYPREISAGRSFFPTDVKNQLIALPVGLFFGYWASRMRPDWWMKWSKLIWIAAFVSLFLPMLPVIGYTQNGAERWFRIPPLPPIQPAEFVKFAAIIYLAGVFATRKEWKPKPAKDLFDRLDRNTGPWIARIWPMLWVGIAAFIIEREPDLGTAAIVGVIAFMVCIVGGASRKTLALGFVALLVLGGAMSMVKSYRMDRITNHLHRWDDSNIDSTGYQTVQSELGMAEGGVLGVGPGNGRAKHVLPAATTDFVLATVGEEAGFLGSVGILGLIGWIVFRMLELAQRATTKFGAIVVTGVAAWIGLQATLNIMMSNGLLPAIGVPMPFISYGGSSLVSLWVALGICNSMLAVRTEEEHEPSRRRNRWRNRRPRLSRA